MPPEKKRELLIISSGDFFSTYGGGQVYVKNLVDELIRQGIQPSIATPGKPGRLIQKYSGCKIFSYDPTAGQAELKKLLLEIQPDVVHAHGHKASFAKACVAVGLPCIVTAHHGGLLCPAGTLLNHRDQICKIKANSHDCLPCVLKNIRGGIAAWPILRILPLNLRLYLGVQLKKLPFLLYITPVMQTSLNIENKAEEWSDICENVRLLIAPSYAIAESMALNGCPKHKICVIPHGIPLTEVKMPRKFKPEQEADRPVRFFRGPYLPF